MIMKLIYLYFCAVFNVTVKKLYFQVITFYPLWREYKASSFISSCGKCKFYLQLKKVINIEDREKKMDLCGMQHAVYSTEQENKGSTSKMVWMALSLHWRELNLALCLLIALI